VIRRRPGNRRDFQRQYQRNPARCQATTLSGFTMRRTSFQPDHNRRSMIQNSRSDQRSGGRGRFRLSTATCCRRARISSGEINPRPKECADHGGHCQDEIDHGPTVLTPAGRCTGANSVCTPVGGARARNLVSSRSTPSGSRRS
jgi:hypothetical protein